jgi:hypothetical protein
MDIDNKKRQPNQIELSLFIVEAINFFLHLLKLLVHLERLLGK